jgi:hypothetical protein
MRPFSWLQEQIGMRRPPSSARLRSTKVRPAWRWRPQLEALEERWMPSTLTVTNIKDSGAGSLRAEIAAARKGDTIVFASSLDGQTITLTSGQLLINNNLTITGPGASQLTISGHNASRVFEVAKGTSQVTVSGLTISNGLATNGAGIENYGVLTVSNSTLSGNSASVGGAGIYNHSVGTLTVSNSTLTRNTASNSGGGINNDGTVTITNSTLSNNSTGYGGAGGGIINGGTMTVSSSTLSSNSATLGGSGGGIENSGTLTVNNCTLSGNSAGQGGGIDSGGALTVNGSKLLSNSAGQGGGISAGGSVTVSSSKLTGNSATYGGGGIFVQNGTLTLGASTLSGNSASEGGAIFVNGSGTATLTNDTMGSNTATSYGGGIYIVPAATVSLDSFTVANIINNKDGSGLNGPTANIDGSYTLRSPSATSTVVSANVNPSIYGTAVVFTAAVGASPAGSGTPTGSVSFMDFGNLIGHGILSAGRATFSTASLSGGNHALTTVYAGNGSFLGSTSRPYGEKVNPATTSTVVKSSLNPSVHGQPVTFTALVRMTVARGAAPTGTVVFKDGSAVLGSATLTSSQATFSTAGLAVGNHAITVVYGGDKNYSASTSGAFGQAVHSSTMVAVESLRPSVDSARSLPSFMTDTKAHVGLALVPANVDNFFAAVLPTRQRSTPIPLAKKPPPSTGDWLAGVLER